MNSRTMKGLGKAALPALALWFWGCGNEPTGNTNPAPTVTSTAPAHQAANVAPTATIQITFSRAMDKAATEAAVSSTPAISGTFAWSDGDKTLTWTPGSALAEGTSYNVMVSKAAKSAAGAAMAADKSFTFTVQGGAAPSVLETMPEDGARQVELDVVVEVTFSAAMDESATEQAFSLTTSGGPVEGSFSWNAGATTLSFTPSDPLLAGMEYEIQVTPDAKSAGGANLAGAFSSTFTTKTSGDAPSIVESRPENGAADVSRTPSVILTFSEPMDIPSVEDALSFTDQNGDPVEFGASWNDVEDARVLTLDPISVLDPNTEYTVTVTTAAQSEIGVSMLEEFILSFTTIAAGGPVVLSARPVDGDTAVALDAVIEIEFDVPMQHAATEAAVYVEDADGNPVTGAFSWDAGDRVLTFTPTAALTAQTRYEVNVGPRATSEDGEKMEGEYFFSFTTGDAKKMRLTRAR